MGGREVGWVGGGGGWEAAEADQTPQLDHLE